VPVSTAEKLIRWFGSAIQPDQSRTAVGQQAV
jgi:hypothetical protein